MIKRNRTKGLYLHLPSHRAFFEKAMVDLDDTAPLQMPARTRTRVFGQPVAEAVATPFGSIKRIAISECSGSSIPGHQLVDVYRQTGSSTYPIMDTEPTHKARVAWFIAQCRCHGIEIAGEVK